MNQPSPINTAATELSAGCFRGPAAFLRRLAPAGLCLLALLLPACDGGSGSRDQGQPETEKAAPAAGAESAEETRPPAEPREAGPEAGPVVATVNGVPIGRQLFESQLALGAAEAMRFDDPADDQDQAAEADQNLRLNVLNNLISLELACQEAVRRGYAPGDEELDEAVEEIRKNYESPEELKNILSQSGDTEEDLRGQLAKTMALRNWQRDAFLADIKVSPEEVRAYYDENRPMLEHGLMVRASQIFFPTALLAPAEEKARIKTRAEMVGQLLKGGEDFNYLAAEFSAEPEDAEKMGALGWVERGRNFPALEQAIFTLKPGEVSEMIETPLGFYYIKVFEIREPGVLPFSEARGLIVGYLSNQKLEKAFADKMVELYERAEIEIQDATLKRAYDQLMAE